MLCDFLYLRNEHERVPDLNHVRWLRMLVPRDKVYAVVLNDHFEPFINALEFRLPSDARGKGLYLNYSITYGASISIEDARNLYRALIHAGFTVSQQYDSVLMPEETKRYFPHLA